MEREVEVEMEMEVEMGKGWVDVMGARLSVLSRAGVAYVF